MTTTSNIGYDEAKAIKWNAKYCERLGWYGQLDEKALAAFPCLASDPLGDDNERAEFSRGVYSLQMLIFAGDEDDADGLLGGGTLDRIDDHFHPHRRHYLIGDRKQFAPERENVSRVLTYKDRGGFDLHRSSTTNRRGKPVRWLVGHWSATTTLEGCYRTLLNKGFSSNVGIGLIDKKPVIAQWIGAEWITAHAGLNKRVRKKYPNAISGNKDAEGFDICSTPVTGAFRSLRKKGHDVRIVNNPTVRGDEKILTLDPQLAMATAEYIVDRCIMLGLPIQWPVSATEMGTGTPYDGVISRELWKTAFGIVLHCMLHPGKWDLLCWFATIIECIREIVAGTERAF